MTATEPFDVAVVQDASLLLDRDASIGKTIALAREATGNGAKLVLFPEAFISGYPRGLSFGAVVGSRSAEGRKLFRRYAESAMELAGADAARLGAATRELGIHLAVGVVERDPVSSGTLYCSLALWGPDGILQSLHRKLKPTASERLIWGEGGGEGMFVAPTPLGNVGGLICADADTGRGDPDAGPQQSGGACASSGTAIARRRAIFRSWPTGTSRGGSTSTGS